MTLTCHVNAKICFLRRFDWTLCLAFEDNYVTANEDVPITSATKM